jgi:hypothetical protein
MRILYMRRKNVKESESEGAEAGGEKEVHGGDFKTLWPRLHWELTSLTYGDSVTPRSPTAASFFRQDGLFKVCLRDRSQGLVAFLSAMTLDELLAKLEAALTDVQLDWRKDKYAQHHKDA